MANTILILGTDPEQCKELGNVLRDRIADAIVTISGENLPAIKDSDTLVIASEEKNVGVLYRRVLSKLEEQVQRARFLGEMLRLFSASHEPKHIVEQVAIKSTEVLGDTAFVILANDQNSLRLDAAHSRNPDILVKILMSLMNEQEHRFPDDMLREVMVRKVPRLIENLSQEDLPSDLSHLVIKNRFSSLIVAPIQTKDYVLGAFVSVCTAPRVFDQEDLKVAVEIADYAGIALENASLFSELQRSAITDSLTNIYNTRFFNEVLVREAARAERYAAPLSLLMIDVDSFKLVNDTFGHLVGNKVLTQIAKALQRAVRDTDFVFRCGGDEFGVVLPETNLDGALRAAGNILRKIEHANILPGLGYSGLVTVSIGAAEFRRGSPHESMVAEADQALYASKRSSKNTSRAYEL